MKEFEMSPDLGAAVVNEMTRGSLTDETKTEILRQYAASLPKLGTGPNVVQFAVPDVATLMAIWQILQAAFEAYKKYWPATPPA